MSDVRASLTTSALMAACGDSIPSAVRRRPCQLGPHLRRKLAPLRAATPSHLGCGDGKYPCHRPRSQSLRKPRVRLERISPLPLRFPSPQQLVVGDEQHADAEHFADGRELAPFCSMVPAMNIKWRRGFFRGWVVLALAWVALAGWNERDQWSNGGSYVHSNRECWDRLAKWPDGKPFEAEEGIWALVDEFDIESNREQLKRNNRGEPTQSPNEIDGEASSVKNLGTARPPSWPPSRFWNA
jgi:hypothetical protein